MKVKFTKACLRCVVIDFTYKRTASIRTLREDDTLTVTLTLVYSMV